MLKLVCTSSSIDKFISEGLQVDESDLLSHIDDDILDVDSALLKMEYFTKSAWKNLFEASESSLYNTLACIIHFMCICTLFFYIKLQ